MTDMISKAVGTGSISSSQRWIDMRNKIGLLEPDKAPLTILLKNIASEACDDPKFQWLNDVLGPVFDAINLAAGYPLGTETSLVVDNGAYFNGRDAVLATNTGEIFTVTSVSSNTLTVVRGVAGTAAALVDNDELRIIGNCSEEGATAPDMKETKPAAVYNYTQIFRKSFGVTNTQNKSKTFAEAPLPWNRRKKAIEHAKDIESAFLFGKRAEVTGGTHYKRLTGGIFENITTNVSDLGAAVTEQEFDEAMETAFRYGSPKKLFICSAKWVTILDQWAKSKLQLVPKDQTYGITLTRYMTSHGELMIHKHHLLEGTKYANYAVILDADNMKYRYLNGRDTVLKTNIQANDADGEQDEYITEAGLEFGDELRHSILYTS